MPGLGPIGLPELLIILVIVILIFGVGKLPEVGGALGKGIREFKTNVAAGEEDTKKQPEGEKPKA
jgi:sec-independent protein translocase protein TatA